jgi:GDP-4-dehydro-6-deoxy-D-mannose reductase
VVRLKPDIIINCAGIIENTEKAFLNVTYTENLLRAITESGHAPMRLIIIGSAAEYGVLGSRDLVVDENVATEPAGNYGRAKAEEIQRALKYGEKHGIPVIVARLFNPLGPNMKGKFLTSNIISQIKNIKVGERHTIELGRLDAGRDYVDVRDAGEAIILLAESSLRHAVYNIGSGVRTSNRTIVEILLETYSLPPDTPVTETNPLPEPFVAERANISRIHRDTGWKPKHTILDTIRSIYDEQ